MKKIATVSLIALALAGCGMLPTTTSATTTTTSTSSLLSIMGLDSETATDSEVATDSESPDNRMGPGQMLFLLLDADGNGKITLEELSTTLKARATVDDTQLQELFDKMDRDGDGALVLSELQPQRQIRHRPPRGGHRGHGRPEFGQDEGDFGPPPCDENNQDSQNNEE